MRFTDRTGRDAELLPLLGTTAFLLLSPSPRFVPALDVAKYLLPARERRLSDRRQGERRRNRREGRRIFARRTGDRLTVAEALERATLERRLAAIRRQTVGPVR